MYMQSLYKYINTRNLKPGALFAYPSGQPVSRHEFISQLNRYLKFIGLSIYHIQGSLLKGWGRIILRRTGQRRRANKGHG